MTRGGVRVRGVVATVAIAVAVAVALPLAAGDLPAAATLLVFLGLAVAAENAAVVLPTGLRLSPACMIVLAAIVALDGTGAVPGAAAVGAGCGLVLAHLRDGRYRLVAFNCAQYALAGAAAAAAHGGVDLAPLAVVAGAAAFAAVNVATVLAAVAAEGKVAPARAWADMAPHLPSYLFFAVLGSLLGLLHREAGAAAVIVLASGLLLARSAFAAANGHRRAAGLVELLNHRAHAADLEVDEREALRLLDDVRERFNGERAELLLVTSPTTALALHVAASGAAGSERVRLDERPVERQVLAGGGACLVGEPDPAMAARGIGDAAVAPLGGLDMSGTLLVANRRAVNGGYTAAEVDDLVAVAGSVGASVERHRLFRRLRWESTHDALTGHLNRSALLDALVAALSADEPCGAVMLLDIDGFKEINDTLGHDHGDALLREMGEILGRVASPGSIIGRVGGDEFVVVEPCPESGVDALTARLLVALDAPVEVGAVSIDVSVSVGVARFPADGGDAITLLQRAEVAMYAAKEGGTGLQTYQPHHERGSARRALESDLRAAVERGGITIEYQPKVALDRRQVVGCEALARWEHPVHGAMAPQEFIALAEQSGLIRPLTLAVLRQATLDCARWRARGHDDVTVAVNLSAPLLLDTRLPEELAGILDRARLAPSALTLEITESSIMRDASRSIAVLERLSAMGVRLSIDDFGTGYSSLAYLRDLPVDEIKIDRSFVKTLDAGNDAIVRLTLELARTLGLTVVAEGVEDASAWTRLSALGCDEAQGWFFSKPLPVGAFEQWLVAFDEATPHTRAPEHA